MATIYTELADFDSSSIDASLNGQALCDELKRLYEYLMTAVAMQRFKWDSVGYIYNADKTVDYVDFTKGTIIIRKRYYYSNNLLSYTRNFIWGVPPETTDWQYIHGQTYNYDSNDLLISVVDRVQT